MTKDMKKAYRTIMDDHFPPQMEISFVDEGKRQTLFFEKVTWIIDDVKKGLRYGENPGQEAALYRLVNGNLILGNAETIQPGIYLASDMELLQSGKHPGKTNITDADNALNILRYFHGKPTTVIVKHNNPCGVARANSLEEAYSKAYMADRIAAFGGCIAVNCPVDKATAELIAAQYAEVVVAPEYEEGAMEILASRKNLRIIRIRAIDTLYDFIGQRYIDFKSLMDGGIIAQWSFALEALTKEALFPAESEYKGELYTIERQPTEKEYQDMLFGWSVESGITSNSVIYVKDECTIGIGTGEQDRVGVAEIARDKAYRKMLDRLSWEFYDVPYKKLFLQDDGQEKSHHLKEVVMSNKGGLVGATMVSDAFFPFDDGVNVGLEEGVTAVIQPGGSLNDWQSIEACNQAGATMKFTGQRSFKH